jgi:hypothetical protein
MHQPMTTTLCIDILTDSSRAIFKNVGHRCPMHILLFIRSNAEIPSSLFPSSPSHQYPPTPKPALHPNTPPPPAGPPITIHLLQPPTRNHATHPSINNPFPYSRAARPRLLYANHRVSHNSPASDPNPQMPFAPSHRPSKAPPPFPPPTASRLRRGLASPLPLEPPWSVISDVEKVRSMHFFVRRAIVAKRASWGMGGREQDGGREGAVLMRGSG